MVFFLGAFNSDGDLAGTVRIEPCNGPKKSHRADVFFMFVHTTLQNKGVGRLLINNTIDRAREIEGLEQLELSVSTDCPRALHLYKKAGFEVAGSLKHQIKIGNSYYDYITNKDMSRV